MSELPGTSAAEPRNKTEPGATPPVSPPMPARDQADKPEWWAIQNFSHLVIWWVVVIGYYVVFNSLSGRYHRGLIDWDMVSDGWYVILASGVIGALYAKRLRPVWFLISIALAMIILLLMLLGLGTLKTLMNP
jgi:hypothetical protein